MCCREEKIGVPGITKNRSCTDIIMLILFACGWAFLIVLLLRAQESGASFDRATRGIDMYGVPCGIASNGNKPYAAWPHPAAYKFKICVDSCDRTMLASTLEMSVNYKTLKLARFCLPDPTDPTVKAITQFSAFDSQLNEASNAVSRNVADLWTLRYVLLVSMGCAVLVGLIMMLIIHVCVRVMVWGTIFSFLGGGVVLGGVFFYRYNYVDDILSKQWRDAWFALALIVWGVTFITLLIVIFLRKQIAIAIEVIKEASRVVSDMKCLVFYPVIPALAIAGYFILFVLMCLWLYSAGGFSVTATDPLALFYSLPNADAGRVGTRNTNPGISLLFVTSDNFAYFGIYNVFHMLWMTQTVYYIGYLVMAGAVAQWYFAVREFDGSKRRGNGAEELPNSPILRSCGRTLFCHIGTAAFAGLLMAIIRFLRAILAYIRRALHDKTNCPARAALCVCACCLRCLDCCMDKISKNALIWTAIFGDGFLTASCSSFSLILTHIAKVAAVNTVSGFILFIMKMFSAFAVTAGVGIFIQYWENLRNDISSLTIPLIIVFICSYCIVAILSQSFETTIDAIFFCFLVDVEYNQNSGQPLRACQELVDIVNGYSEQSKVEAAKSGYGKGVSTGNVARVAPADTDGDNTQHVVVERQ